MNTYLHLTNVNLALRVRKPNLELDLTNNWDLAKLDLILFLNLENFAQESTQCLDVFFKNQVRI